MSGDASDWDPALDPMPADVHCPACGKWRRDHPQLDAYLKARNVKVTMDTWFCQCKDAPQVDDRQQRLERYANLPRHEDEIGPRTLGNFTSRRGAEEGLREAKDYASADITHRILTMVGQTGSGKSHLLEAVARAWLAKGRIVKYEYVPELLDRFRATQNDDASMGFLDVYAQYQAAELLVLDDLGTEKPSAWVTEKLTTLVDERYRNGRYLLVGTNLTRQDVTETYHARLASRLWDVSTGLVRTVYLRATDYRQQK